MDYFCDICGKTNKIKSGNEHLQSLTFIEFDNCVRIKNTIENPNFSDIEAFFNKYITINNMKLDLFLVKYDCVLVFDKEIYPRINSEEFQYINTIFHLERFFLNGLNIFVKERIYFLTSTK